MSTVSRKALGLPHIRRQSRSTSLLNFSLLNKSFLWTRARLYARLRRSCLRFRRRERLYICDHLQELLFTNLTLKRWHDRSEPGNHLRLRIQDRFANVAFICRNTLTVAQHDLAAIDADQRR